MHRCPQCGIDRPTVYLHHGKLYCGCCLPDDQTDDIFTRCAVTRIKSAALREAVREQTARLATMGKEIL